MRAHKHAPPPVNLSISTMRTCAGDDDDDGEEEKEEWEGADSVRQTMVGGRRVVSA